MSKKHKKPEKVNMKKSNDNYIGTISGLELIKHSSTGFHPNRTIKYMTEKDRPRDKSYKKFNPDD